MKYLTLIAVLFSVRASALPILRETAGDFSEGFVTIYPDHRDSKLFYFLPNQINFAMDKTTSLPSFSLQTYAIEQPDLTKAFGFMSFVFRPGISDDVKKQLKAFMARNPKARLAPLPVGESYLAIGENRHGIPAAAAAKIFEHWDLPPYGGLLETEVGGNAYLTGAGAKMFANAIKTPGAAVLNSCYTIDGVTPSMDAEVEIDYHKVFTHFKAKAHVGWWIYGADVSKEVTKLTENGTIKIRLRGDTKFEDMVMEMARQLAKEYLAPSLDNHGSDISLGKTPFRSVRFGFGSVKVEERKNATFIVSKQADITDVRCIAAPFRGLTPYADKLISNTPL